MQSWLIPDLQSLSFKADWRQLFFSCGCVRSDGLCCAPHCQGVGYLSALILYSALDVLQAAVMSLRLQPELQTLSHFCSECL